jgi:hypothetical protein
MPGVALTTAQRKDLEAILAMAQRSGAPSLSVAAERFAAVIEKRARAVAPLPGQLALWENGEPWRGRLAGDDLVRCDRLSTPLKACTIPVRTCIQRQDARWPGKKAKIHEHCGSGKCAQGAEYRSRTDYSAEEDWASKSKKGSTAYQTYRKDAGVQRQRMRQFDLEQVVPGRAEPLSPSAEVADLDPTDEVREIMERKA